ncbi:MAG: prepilin-type N-terminal cleavage/methylation domain-containing protein [Burkholderiaceae bacterium]
MSAPRRPVRGFTLIEVLVALLVMTLMAVMAWRGIDALLKTRDIAQASVEQGTRLQTVIAQWEQDLQMLQDSGVADALSFDGASLRLTRRQAQGMQVVAWTVRDGRLYRWQSEPVQTLAALDDALQRSLQFSAGDTRRLSALEGVSGWQMYCYRENSWSNCQSSGDSVAAAPPAAAPSTPAGPAAPGAPAAAPRQALPSGLRMVLQFDASAGASGGYQGALTREVMLGAQ